MSGALQRFCRRWWAGDAGWGGIVLSAALRPMSWIWSAGAWLRNRRYDRLGGTAVGGLVVVSVGNLAVGGTGKTPLASWIVRQLSASGRHPALLLRGYGRDEALLHALWTPDVPVFVGADRVACAREARDSGSDFVVLDDGFQHRALSRSLDIVLLAVEDPFPGPVLPCGPYREAASALGRADALILTRRSASVAEARRLEQVVHGLEGISGGLVKGSVRLVAADLRRLGVAHRPRGPASVSASNRLADATPPPRLENPVVLTAIARPDTFLRDVESATVGSAELMAFGDHHDFTASDVRGVRARAGSRPIVMTEKDAVKLTDFRNILGEAWVLGQSLEWDWGEGDVLRMLGALVSVENA